MTLSRFVAAIGIGVALLMALAAPASAQMIQFSHSGGGAGAVSGRQNVVVRDTQCGDGWAYMEYDVSTIGGLVRYKLVDPDGCGSAGGQRNHYPQQVTKARLCVDLEGCTGWRYT